MIKMLVDVHVHLDHQYYSDKLDKIIQESKKAGVKYIVTSGINTPSNRKNLEISKKYKDIVKFSAGLYPIDLLGLPSDEPGLPRQYQKINIDEEFAWIKKNKDDIISIGEVGMDFKISIDTKKKQTENFQKIIEFTEKLKKPIVIHSRKAEAEIIDMLQSSKLKKVDMHCFTGNKKLIKKASDLGYTFSIPSIINKLEHFKMLVDMVPLTQLLTETDGPWLSPIPNEMNHPRNVQVSIQEIAKVKKMEQEEVIKNIFMNFQKMFLK